MLTFTLVFPVAQPADAVADRVEKSSAEAHVAAEPQDVVQRYRAILPKSAKRAKPKPKDVVPELIGCYQQLAKTSGVAKSEIKRMRGIVKIRLEQMRDRLLRDNIRRRKEIARVDRRKRQTRVSRSERELLGTEAQNAQALIDLIQATIAPESWDVNGGLGSAYYFPLLKVLVIRQTAEVHGGLGGVLEQLKK